MINLDPTCTLCPRWEAAGIVCIPGFGPKAPELIVIAESPSTVEDTWCRICFAPQTRACKEAGHLRGVPLVGPSGQILRRILDAIGIDPARVFWTNVARCLLGDTPVVLANRNTKSIREIVRTKDPGPVISLDTNSGKLVTRQITGWYRNHRSRRRLLKVSHSLSRHPSFPGDGVGTIATSDHLFLTPSGWCKAEDLDQGLVASGHIGLSETTIWAKATITEAPTYAEKEQTLFCLDVEETHNFLTPGGVVHNCSGGTPKPAQIRKCINAHLIDELAQLDYSRCRAVFLFGELAVRGFLNNPKIKITQARRRVLDEFGPRLPSLNGNGPGRLLLQAPLFATYHPAYALPHRGGESVYKEILADIQDAFFQREPPAPVAESSPAQIQEQFSHAKVLGIDLEWDAHGTPTLLGMSDGNTTRVTTLVQETLTWLCGDSRPKRKLGS